MTDDKLYKSLSANTIMAILTNHVQRITLITSSTDKHNSSFQNYTHPDDHTIRTTDTPGFKPFTMLPTTFSCGMLFAGQEVGARPMKRKKKKTYLMMIIMCAAYPWILCKVNFIFSCPNIIEVWYNTVQLYL